MEILLSLFFIEIGKVKLRLLFSFVFTAYFFKPIYWNTIDSTWYQWVHKWIFILVSVYKNANISNSKYNSVLLDIQTQLVGLYIHTTWHKYNNHVFVLYCESLAVDGVVDKCYSPRKLRCKELGRQQRRPALSLCLTWCEWDEKELSSKQEAEGDDVTALT